MENSASWGPLPTRVPADPDLVLTAQQRRVLDELARHSDPVKITVLADGLSLHHNTVREHLDVLIEHGLARRRAVRHGGRGRPAWAYEAAAGSSRRLGEYRDLAGAFADHLSAFSAHPSAQARDIGRRWGERLAAAGDDDASVVAEGKVDDRVRSSRHRLVRLLGEVGFAPEANPEGDDIALRECPLLDSARAHPEVVCQVHHGLITGVLAAYGNTTDSALLRPFSEPKACRLRLHSADSE